MFLHAWIVYPLVLAFLSGGCGLLLRRAAGAALPGVLVLPVGFACLVVVATALTFLDVTAEFTAPSMAVLAAAGFIVTVPSLRARGLSASGRAWVWPTVAALLPLLAIAAPVLATGQPGFTGYLRIIDLAFQVELAQHFVTDGRAIPDPVGSSFEAVVSRTLSGGYPGGTQAVLGASAQLAGIDPIWAWQGFLAFLGAGLGLALWSLLSGAIAWQPGRAVAAGVAAQPTILYAYGLTGGVKELAAAALVALCAALLTVPRLDTRLSLGGVLPVLVTVVAGLAVFTVGVVPWIAVLLFVALGPRVVRARGRSRAALPRLSWRAASALGVGLAAVCTPLVLGAIKVVPLLSRGGPQDLGNLAAPVPAWAAIGPWLTPDHRYPLEAAGTVGLTAVLAGVVLAFALVGLARALARPDMSLVAAGAAGTVGLAAVFVLGSAWVELKAVTITAPLCLALAFAGAAALAHRPRLRGAALAAGTIVAVAVLAGNVLVFRGTSLAPYERFAELQEIAERWEGQGPALHPEAEEHAEYLLRELDAVGLVNLGSYTPRYRAEAPKGRKFSSDLAFSRDLDDFPLEELEPWQLIVTRRDPAASRPPSDFVLAQRTRHYEVWQRQEGTHQAVSHHPFGAPYGEPTASTCEVLVDELRAYGPRARLVYAPAPPGNISYPFGASSLWLDPGGGQRLMRGPGSVRYWVTAPSSGRYALWLSGSFGRAVTVSVDGRDVGRLRWQANYPLQYEPVATLRLDAGEHLVEVRRGGGSVLPASGNELELEGTTTRVGAVVLASPDPSRPVRTVPSGKAAKACSSEAEWDWAEVVAPVDAGGPTAR